MELVLRPLRRDYPTLDFRQVQIILVEARGSVLPGLGLPHKIVDFAARRLGKKGVKVRVGAEVEAVMPDSIHLRDGSSIHTQTVIWTAGVRGPPAVAEWGLPTTRRGQVEVLRTLQLSDRPNVYVIGDLAAVRDYPGGPLPMVAPVATQQGTTAARNILRQIRGETLEPFEYHDRGTMVVIGRNAAGAYLFNKWSFTGFLAWILWLAIHLFNLIGFQNRLIVLIYWARSYLFYDRAPRLILPLSTRNHSPAEDKASPASAGATR